MNEEELRNLMFTAQLPNKGPFVIRYPRGNGVMPDWRRPFTEIEIGKGRLITAGEELAILSFGAIGNEAVKAVQQLNELGIHPAHYDLRFAKPLDEALLHQVFQKFDKIITVEDGSLQGGIGSAVLEFMADHGYHSQVVRLGIPDKIIEHAEQNAQWKNAHYDANAIVSEAKKLCNGKLTSSMVG
jgi:1-deoxy-D-xylulose-5-phosphate synthase